MSRKARKLSLAERSTGAGAKLARERSVSDHIAITHFVDTDILATRDGDLILVMHLNGAPTETTDIEDLNAALAEKAHLYLAALGGASAQLYHHFIRRAEKFYPEGAFRSEFAKSLDQAWEARLGRERQYRNDHYLTLVMRPKTSLSRSGIFGTKTAHISDEARERAILELRELGENFCHGLKAYGPRILHMSVDEGKSEALSLFSFLMTGEWRRIAPPRQQLSGAICPARLYFGRETVGIEDAQNTRLAACLSIRHYPTETFGQLVTPIFASEAEFAFTQAFEPVLNDKAASAIDLQQRRMNAADDAAISLREQLTSAQDDLASGRLIFGHHHLSITVYAPDQPELAKAISAVRGAMTQQGLNVVRETLGLEPTWWAMLPGNFTYAAGRAALIHSENFADFTSFSATPQGERESVWGPAISVFETSDGTPYCFNFHQHDVGNTVVFGPTGSGKTALLSFLIAQSERVQPRIFIMDKDRGAQILIEAMGGTYTAITPGESAALNPFRMDARGNEAKARSFLTDWVSALLYADQAPDMPAAARSAIKLAVDELRDAPIEARRLEMLAQVLGGGEHGDELNERLAPWIGTGDKAWAFGAAEDKFGSLFGADVLGVDLTHILDDPRVAGPWMMYLFHQIEDALEDGTPTLIVLDEAWRMLGDKSFAARIQDWMLVIRKKSGAVIFATQEPAAALESEAGRTVIAQSPTQILFPNPKAGAEYIEGLRISEYELGLLQQLGSAGRYFLLRKQDQSAIIHFDMKGMEPFMDVLSSRTSSVRRMEALKRQYGTQWLSHFMKPGAKQTAISSTTPEAQSDLSEALTGPGYGPRFKKGPQDETNLRNIAMLSPDLEQRPSG